MCARLKPASVLAALLVTLNLALGGCGGADDRKAAHMAKGRELVAAGELTEARREFQSVLEIDPADFDARLALAGLAENATDWQAAAEQYNTILQADANHVIANLALADLLMRTGNLAEARRYAEQALRIEPDNAGALTIRAGTKFAEGNIAGARADAELALRADPTHMNAIGMLARVFVFSDDADSAIDLVERYLNEDPESVEMLALLASIHEESGNDAGVVETWESIIALEPDNLDHRIALARYHYGRERIDAAEAVMRRALDENPDDLAAKLAFADVIVTLYGPEAGIEALQNMVAATPDLPELRFAIARVHIAQQDWQAARGVLDEIVARSGADSRTALQARTQLAVVAANAGEREEAQTIIDGVLEDAPEDLDALMFRGSLALQGGDPVAAIADYRSAQRNAPDNSALQRLLARAHLANGENELAKTQLLEAVENTPSDIALRTELAQLHAGLEEFDQAIEQLQAVLRIQPTNMGALQGLYRIHAFRQDWDAALEVSDVIKARFPDDGIGHHFAGLIQQARGDAEAGIAEFLAALEVSPAAVEPLTQLVRVYLQLERNQAAKDLLNRIASANEEHTVAYNMLGEIEFAEEDLDAAQAHFETAIAKSPGWDIPYRNLAVTQIARSEFDAAVTTLEQGIEATEGSSLLLTTYASFLERRGDLNRAVEQYARALERDPDNDLAANNLAMILAEYGADDRENLEQARALASQLLDTPNAAYLDTAGWVEFQLGEYDNAVELLKQAVDADPDAAMLRYHLGMAYMEQGNKVEALANLKQAVNANVEFRGLEQAKAAITELESG